MLVQNKLGEQYSIEAPAIILASGGFSANLERVKKYRPEYAAFSSTNQPGATGDGLDLAAEFGAKLVDMEQIQIHPSQAAGSKILITEAVRGNGAICVNRAGKRFMNELTTRDAASAAILKQTGQTAFLVFDETIRRSLKQIEGYFHLELVKSGKTPQELAKAIGADGGNLAATIESYNKFQAAKKDDEFGRPDMPRPVKDPGYYAIEIRPGIHYTMGGVAIDGRCRVLGQDGKAIPGLYAAGEVTGGVHGANRLGGNSISETITFGRIAGREATQFAKAKRTQLIVVGRERPLRAPGPPRPTLSFPNSGRCLHRWIRYPRPRCWQRDRGRQPVDRSAQKSKLQSANTRPSTAQSEGRNSGSKMPFSIAAGASTAPATWSQIA